MRNKSTTKWNGLLTLALPALFPVAGWAEPLLLEAQPNSPETAVVVAPASAPMVNSAEAKLPPGKILVLPFQAVNPNDTSPWLGKSIQESMVADLTVAAPDRVLTINQPASSLDAATALGKQNGARYVAVGGYVTVDKELRVTGQVFDVETGKSVAGLKVTGDPGQIFHMEDALALQVRAQVFGQQVGPTQPPSPQQQNPGQLIPEPSNNAVAPDAGVVAEANPQPQYYSSYATPATPVVYGGDSTAATYYPSYSTTYSSGYDPYYYPVGYSYSPYYCDYGYYGGCYPFGLGFGFFFGPGFCYGYGRYGYGYGRGYYGGYYRGGYRGGYGNGRVGIYASAGGASIRAGGIGISAGVRSADFRSSYASSAGATRSAARVTSGVPYRASAFYQTSSFGRAGGIGGFHAGSGFSAHASFGGSGGGFSHGGGGGGGHAGGGGHR